MVAKISNIKVDTELVQKCKARGLVAKKITTELLEAYLEHFDKFHNPTLQKVVV